MSRMRRAIFLLLVTSAVAPAIAGEGEPDSSRPAWKAWGGERPPGHHQSGEMPSARGERPATEERRDRIFSPQRAEATEAMEAPRPLPESRPGSATLRRPLEKRWPFEKRWPDAGIGQRLPRTDSMGPVARQNRAVRRSLDPLADPGAIEAVVAAEAPRIKRIRIGDSVRVVRQRRPVEAGDGRAAVVGADAARSPARATDWRRHQRGWTSSSAPGPVAATATDSSAMAVHVDTARPLSDRSGTAALRSGSPRRPAGSAVQIVDRRHWSGSHYHPPWAVHWRDDQRFDWRDHRNHHRSLFRHGGYYDPFGFGYQRFVIGWSIWPAYYRTSYWIDNPSSYRLPPPYGPYRWVRYHDDALLIDLDSGEVVDVIYNFFW